MVNSSFNYLTKDYIKTYYNEKIKNLSSSCKSEEFSAHSAKVHSVAWNCNGTYLASGSYDKSICVFSLDGIKLNKELNFKGHTDSVDQLCWHCYVPELLASASGDKSVRIWDIKSNSCLKTIQTKGENINICWSPNGNTIAVGNKEDLVTFIDVRNYKVMHEEQFKYEVNEISWDNSNVNFYITNGNGCVVIMNFNELKTIHTIQAHPANCISIKFDPTGKYFATGSADALVSLWSVEYHACIRTFSRLDWPVRSISFNYDGMMLASASEDLYIDIAMVETGEKICDVQCSAPTFTIAWHPTSNVLAFACDEKDKHERDAGTVRLFSLN